LPPAPAESVSARPSTWLLHLGFVLTGIGTALVGPLLPLLAMHWHMQDARSGLLITGQFIGAFFGGVTVLRNLRRSLLIGSTAAAVGLGLFAYAPSTADGVAPACAALCIAGYGIGQLITVINLIAGERHTTNRGSALSLLNFSWSFGAILSPLLVAWLAPVIGVPALLSVLAAAFFIIDITFAAEFLSQPAPVAVQAAISQAADPGITLRVFFYFAALLVLYGGLETCMGAWLTTYAQRYGNHGLAISAYITVIFWASLTGGRALASWLLLLVPEKMLLRISLAIAVAATAALAVAHSAGAIAACALLIGLNLAPWFPVTFSLLVARRPIASQAGTIIAVSALGAALLPWLMGFVSTRSGSLQMAVVLPLLTAAALLVMSFLQPRETASL
jgi:fucose permease